MPCPHGPSWGGLESKNSKGFCKRGVNSDALPVKSPASRVLPSNASSSAAGSVERCVGYVFGEASELHGALSLSSTELIRVSSPSSNALPLVSSGELWTVCDSRKCDGVLGACGFIAWLLMEGFREEDAEPGDVGLREVISGGLMLSLHGEEGYT